MFDSSVIGTVEPSAEWTYENTDYINPNAVRAYYPNQGYSLIQGTGRAVGRLFGGHTGLMELENTSLQLSAEDFRGKILFIEDIPEFFSPQKLSEFLDWLGKIGALRGLNGIVIGKANEKTDFIEQKALIRQIISRKYGLLQLPVLYGLNFGHSSPMTLLPYGRMAEIDCETRRFSILENGVEPFLAAQS